MFYIFSKIDNYSSTVQCFQHGRSIIYTSLRVFTDARSDFLLYITQRALLLHGKFCIKESCNNLTIEQTWSTLVLSHTPLKVEIFGTLGIRAIFFLAPSLLFLLFDTIIPSLAVSIKRQGGAALPTRSVGVQGTKRGGGKPQWYTVVGLSTFNVLLGIGIQAGVEFLFTEVFRIRSALKVTTTLPMPWSIAKDVIRGLLLREVHPTAPPKLEFY